MIDVQDLKYMREDLEELLNKIQAPKKDAEIELRVYDLIILSREKYSAKRHKYIDQIAKTATDDSLTAEEKTGRVNTEAHKLVMKCGHAPAYIFILNFNPEDPNQVKHVCAGTYNRSCVGKSILSDDILDDIYEISNEDNAVVVRQDGIIHATNVQLVDINPQRILGKPASELIKYQELGFTQEVHTRHLCTIGASFHLPNSVDYTLGESGNVRRYYQGNITFSTLEDENKMAKERMKAGRKK